MSITRLSVWPCGDMPLVLQDHLRPGMLSLLPFYSVACSCLPLMAHIPPGLDSWIASLAPDTKPLTCPNSGWLRQLYWMGGHHQNHHGFKENPKRQTNSMLPSPSPSGQQTDRSEKCGRCCVSHPQQTGKWSPFILSLKNWRRTVSDPLGGSAFDRSIRVLTYGFMRSFWEAFPGKLQSSVHTIVEQKRIIKNWNPVIEDLYTYSKLGRHKTEKG